MAAAVVANGTALVVRKLGEARDDLLHRLVGPLGALESGVRLVDVRLMVLVVMDPHGRLIDVWLEGGVVVGEGRYLVGHLGSFRSVPALDSIPGPGAPAESI